MQILITENNIDLKNILVSYVLRLYWNSLVFYSHSRNYNGHFTGPFKTKDVSILKQKEIASLMQNVPKWSDTL